MPPPTTLPRSMNEPQINAASTNIRQTRRHASTLTTGGIASPLSPPLTHRLCSLLSIH